MRKKALITGASRGIGRAIAERFAKQGYDLILVCQKNKEVLETLCTCLEADYSVICKSFTGDISDEAFVTNLFDGLGSLDVLINNAGISHIGLISEMSLEEWNRILSVNLTSVFLCCRAALPYMLLPHRGRIINISSVWGIAGASMETAYSASKGGLNSFTKALARELAPSNIQVNAIACGVIDTDMNSCFTAEEKNALKEEIPANRLGSPEDAALLALQLAEASEYMTGQIIALDGGWIS